MTYIVRTRIAGFLMFVLHCIDTASDSFWENQGVCNTKIFFVRV